ncbi:MAG: glycosyltransferase [Acidimicrobiales bacterium]
MGRAGATRLASARGRSRPWLGEMTLRLMHVVDSDQRRGAELFAADLISDLQGREVDQRVAVLTGTPADRLNFQAPTSLLPTGGPMIPGLKLDARTMLGLRRLIRDAKPDIIQAHGGDTLKYTAVATLGCQTRLVQRAIGSPRQDARVGARRFAYGCIFSRSQRIVAVAESVRSEMIDVFRVRADRVVVIPNACDVTRLRPTTDSETTRTRLNVPLDAPVILSLGALTWEKDPLEHLEVTACLARSSPACHHLIVGEGPLRSAVELRIKELGINDRVTMLGQRGDVGDLLAASDVMLLASRIEGMPGVVIEAGLAGLPVVAYSVAGVSEIIRDGTTGYLVPAGDRNALVAHIQSLLADSPHRVAMGEAARLRNLANFEIGVVGPKYFDLYQKLLEGST